MPHRPVRHRQLTLSTWVAILAAAAVAAAGLVATSILSARGDEPGTGGASAEIVGGAAEVEELLAGIPQDGIVLGDPDAPVTLVEYADMQCPFCAEWARGTFPVLVDEYVRPGALRIELRGLAFIGDESEAALRAALAAGRQGKLWNVVDLLFANQGPENGGWVTESFLRAVGESVPGLDADRMLADSSSGEVTLALADASNQARVAGVDGTPSFALGLSGESPERLEISSLGPDEFRAAIDRLLAG